MKLFHIYQNSGSVWIPYSIYQRGPEKVARCFSPNLNDWEIDNMSVDATVFQDKFIRKHSDKDYYSEKTWQGLIKYIFEEWNEIT